MLGWSDKFGRGAGYQEDVGLARNAGLYVENIHAPVHEQNKLSLDNLDGESVFQSYLQCVTDCQVLIEPFKSYHYGRIMTYIFSVLGEKMLRKAAGVEGIVVIGVKKPSTSDLIHAIIYVI